MKISVILPTYNEARHIAHTVEHLRVTGGNFLSEIIVADGGSTDGTLELAEGAGAVLVRCSSKGRGPQLNEGAERATGDVLYFVHADVLPPSTWATDIQTALDNGCVIGNFQYRFDKSGLLLRFSELFTRLPWLFCQGGDKTLFIRREVFFQLVGFDSEYVIMEEYEFLRRARKRGYQWRTLPCNCLVSARKYERNSWLRVQIANFIVYNMWAWGLAHPSRLRELYWRILR